ncbi:hypothetical protein [Streptomyces sp. H27-G5]|uniref:hypothetical protein n=1 Tax=Streptomyces sp. H27-G5 TaxID=2996698 RepID=UPI003B63EBD7
MTLPSSWSLGLTAARREAYANDLGQQTSLVAVTAHSNRQKSDQDPAEWLRPSADALCRYGTEWIATKLRWGLAVDEPERDRLLDIAAECGDTQVELTPARPVSRRAAPLSSARARDPAHEVPPRGTKPVGRIPTKCSCRRGPPADHTRQTLCVGGLV